MNKNELSRKNSTERDEDSAIQKRLYEYFMNKIDHVVEIIRRAIKHKIISRFVLADRWFIRAKMVCFIRSRHIKCDYNKNDKGRRGGKNQIPL